MEADNINVENPHAQLLRECASRAAPDGGGDPRGPGGVWRSFLLFCRPALTHFDARNIGASLTNRDKLRDHLWLEWCRRHPDVVGFSSAPSRNPLPWELAVLLLIAAEPFSDRAESADQWFVLEILVRDMTATNDFISNLRRWEWYPAGKAGPGDAPMVRFDWRGRSRAPLSVTTVAEEITEGVTRLVVLERDAATGDELWRVARELASGRDLTVRQNLRQFAQKGIGHDGSARKRKQHTTTDVAVWVVVVTESDHHIPTGMYARTRVGQLDLVSATAAAPEPMSRAATEYAYRQTLRVHWLGLPPKRLLPRPSKGGPHFYLGAVVGEWAGIDPATGEAAEGTPQRLPPSPPPSPHGSVGGARRGHSQDVCRQWRVLDRRAALNPIGVAAAPALAI
eukprot:gene8729-16101_t